MTQPRKKSPRAAETPRSPALSANPDAPRRITPESAMQIALKLFERGDSAKARDLLGKLLQKLPQHAAALHLLGIIQHQSGNLAAGIELLGRAVKLSPETALFHANLCEMYRQAERLDEAIEHGRKAAELDPGLAKAHCNLGVAYYDQGEDDLAEASQRRAVELQPDLAASLNNLGSLLRKKNDREGSIAMFRKALAVAPTYVEPANNLASVLTDNEQPEEALKILLPLVKSQPRYAEAHCNIANAMMLLEKPDAAEQAYRNSLTIRPDYVEARIGLARVMQEKRNLPEARRIAEAAIEVAPERADVHNLLASVLGESGFPKQAAVEYDKALELDPKHVGALLGRGHLRMENGDIDGAQEDFNQALALSNSTLAARLALAQVAKVKPGDDNMAALVAESEKLETMPELKAMSLHFALGKCYEDTKQYDLAFGHYQEGCRLKRKRIAYSADNTDLIEKNIREFFSKERIERLSGGGSNSRLPIFVLGMPRSGTTLTETILDSHPMVFGAGELSDIMMVANSPRGEGLLEQAGYPFSLNELKKADLKRMGDRYAADLQRRAPDAARITDKMPANFNFLGLIHLMLPKAKIVHVRRNPVDTCLSCFTRLFNKSQYHSYDLTDLGRYYRNYAHMMEHWRKVLPAGSFYEIQYEELVADPETQVRALLEYCELEWDDACLEFHKTERHVRTASVTQVRQPIYKSSVEKWRHYEKHLSPLLEALGEYAQPASDSAAPPPKKPRKAAKPRKTAKTGD